jgi:hypothetical protein
MPDVNDRVTLFRGVQKYLIGAVIVGQSIAITSMALYIVRLQNQHVNELRGFMDYIRTKSDDLQDKLDRSQQVNKELVEKTEEATKLLTTKPGKK